MSASITILITDWQTAHFFFKFQKVKWADLWVRFYRGLVFLIPYCSIIVTNNKYVKKNCKKTFHCARRVYFAYNYARTLHTYIWEQHVMLLKVTPRVIANYLVLLNYFSELWLNKYRVRGNYYHRYAGRGSVAHQVWFLFCLIIVCKNRCPHWFWKN